MKYDIRHLESLCTYRNGPVQDDEALFLFALCKMIRPKTIVEFGFAAGLSAWNFVKAADPHCKIYSYDIVRRRPVRQFGGNFKLLVKDQSDFRPEDIDGRKIDLLFSDGSHNLSVNQTTFTKVLPHLSPRAVVAIHDTGYWTKESFANAPEEYKKGKEAVLAKFKADPNYKHYFLPAERKYVNWIKKLYPEFQQISLHCDEFHRHGLTIMQRHQVL